MFLPYGQKAVDSNAKNPKSITKDGIATIAVFYDPISKKHFASTLPRGDPLVEIKSKKGNAPMLFWVLQQTGLHSEDGAYFDFETTPGGGSVTKLEGRYPEKSVVVSWTGGFGSKIGKIIPACSGGGFRNGLGCYQIATDLGVEHTGTKVKPRENSPMDKLIKAAEAAKKKEEEEKKKKDAELQKAIEPNKPTAQK